MPIANDLASRLERTTGQPTADGGLSLAEEIDLMRAVLNRSGAAEPNVRSPQSESRVAKLQELRHTIESWRPPENGGALQSLELTVGETLKELSELDESGASGPEGATAITPEERQAVEQLKEAMNEALKRAVRSDDNHFRREALSMISLPT